MREPKFFNIKNYISKEIPVITPDETSVKGYFVPEIIAKYGKFSGMLKRGIFIFPKMLKAAIQITISYRSLKKNRGCDKTTISVSELEALTNYITKLGCASGFTKVSRGDIFSNKVILFNKAIVITMPMKKEAIAKAPHTAASHEIWRAYANLGENVNKIASFLRARGFKAEAGPALGGETNYPKLAQKAGLGYVGKHGLLISKGLGPSQRIAVVYTDIENLPYGDPGEYAWIKTFCNSCNRCVKNCPAEAIYKDTHYFENGGEKHIDYKKCALPFSKTMGCSVCIKSCTFFHNDTSTIKAQFLGENKKTANEKEG